MNVWMIVAFLLVFLVGIICIYTTCHIVFDDWDVLEKLFLSTSFGVILLTVIATLTAVLSHYSLWAVSGIYLLVCGMAVAFCSLKMSFRQILSSTVSSFDRKKLFSLNHIVLFVFLFVVFGIYISKPTYYLWSGRDYGVYAINAIHTAETGSSLYETDEELNVRFADLDRVIEPGYPAFYSSYTAGLSDKPGDINTQFLSLYWCYLAIGYSLVGLRGLVRMNAVLAVLSLGILYCLANRFFNRKVAWLSVIFLALCPAQIWGARITQSEQLAQMLFLFAMFLWGYGMSQKRKAALHMAIVFLGLNYLCRIDSYILGIGLSVLCVYLAMTNQSSRKDTLEYTSHHIWWLALSAVLCRSIHRSYFEMIWNAGQLKYLLLANVGCVILLLLVMLVRLKKPQVMPDIVTWLCQKKAFAVLGIVLCTLFFGALYLFDPMHDKALYNYMFYLCPLLFVVAIVGMWLCLYAKNENDYTCRIKPMLLLYIAGFSSVLMYTVRPSITMDHYFMSRRWVSVNFPFLFLMGACGFLWFWDAFAAHHKIRVVAKIMTTAAVVFVIGYLFDKDLILLKNQAYEDLAIQLNALAEGLPDDELILTRNEAAAGYLHHVSHKNIYLIKNDADMEQLRDYLLQGNEVYFMGEKTEAPMWGISINEVSPFMLSSSSPESCYDYYPKEIAFYSRNADLYLLEAETENDYVDLQETVVRTDNAVLKENRLELYNEGCAFYGPYYNLVGGEYELSLSMQGDEQKTIGVMEIVFNEIVVASFNVETNTEYQYPIVVGEEGAIVQTRFIKTDADTVTVTQMELSR